MMPKQTSEDKPESDETKRAELDPDSDADRSWASDQRRRSYYYDDATGYQDYVPDDDDDDEDDENSHPNSIVPSDRPHQ